MHPWRLRKRVPLAEVDTVGSPHQNSTPGIFKQSFNFETYLEVIQMIKLILLIHSCHFHVLLFLDLPLWYLMTKIIFMILNSKVTWPPRIHDHPERDFSLHLFVLFCSQAKVGWKFIFFFVFSVGNGLTLCGDFLSGNPPGSHRLTKNDFPRIFEKSFSRLRCGSHDGVKRCTWDGAWWSTSWRKFCVIISSGDDELRMVSAYDDLHMNQCDF